jgi:hypothetical protein
VVKGSCLFVANALADIGEGPPPDYSAACSVFVFGSVCSLISRVRQIVDVFATADRLRKDGKVAELRPVIDVRPDSVSFQVSCSF